MGDPTLLYPGLLVQHFGFVAASSSRGTSFDTGGSHVKGSWQSLTTDDPPVPLKFDGRGVSVCVNVDSTSQHLLLDFGIGPDSDNVVVLLPNIFVYFPADSNGSDFTWYIPIRVPRGQYLWVRGQTSLLITPEVAISVYGGGKLATSSYSKMAAWGVDPAASKGKNIDPGAEANTWGSWVEMSPAAEFDAKQLSVLCFQDNTSAAEGSWAIQVAIGASSSEVVRLHHSQITQDPSKDVIVGGSILSFPFFIPRGTRVSMRAVSSVTLSPDRILDCAMYALG